LITCLLGYLVLSNQGQGFEKVSAEQESLLKTWLEDSSERDSNPYMYCMVFLLDTIKDRVFFVTETGKVGFCLPHAQIGDEVWVFHGGNVPFVVRPQTRLGRRFYNFIGDCTMEGIMFGELFEEEGFKERNGVRIIIR
jgi:hypothetical protein